MEHGIITVLVVILCVLAVAQADCETIALKGCYHDKYNGIYSYHSECSGRYSYKSSDPTTPLYLYRMADHWVVYNLHCDTRIETSFLRQKVGFSWQERNVTTDGWQANPHITKSCTVTTIATQPNPTSTHYHTPEVVPDDMNLMDQLGLPNWWLKTLFMGIFFLALCSFCHKNRHRICSCYTRGEPDSLTYVTRSSSVEAPEVLISAAPVIGPNIYNSAIYNGVPTHQGHSQVYGHSQVQNAPPYTDTDEATDLAPPSYDNALNDAIYNSQSPPAYHTVVSQDSGNDNANNNP